MIRASAVRPAAVAIIIVCIFYWARKAILPSDASHYPLYTEYESLEDQYPGLLGDPEDDDLIADASDIDVFEVGAVAESIFPQTFPRQIWQSSTLEDQEKWAKQSATWVNKNVNPLWHYNHLDDDAITAFVHENFVEQQSIIRFWDDLDDVILRADLFRYLVLLARGGVYADTDTTNLIPIDDWIPEHLYKSVNAVIGIEYDDKPLEWAIRPISFCQWTLMAKPNHPLFHTAVRRVMSNLEFIARSQRVELGQIKLEFNEVLAATGPGLMTDVVMEVLRDQIGELTWESFRDIRQPTLFGDILILPINGFAGNQKHSHSGNPAYGAKLVQHHFGRSWYHKDQTGEKVRLNVQNIGEDE